MKFVKTCVPYLSTILSAEYFWISDKNDGVKYLDNGVLFSLHIVFEQRYFVEMMNFE